MTIPAGEYLRSGPYMLSESEFLAGTGACGPTSIAEGMRWATMNTHVNGKYVLNALYTATPRLCTQTGVMTTTQIRQSLPYLHLRNVTTYGPHESVLDFARRFCSGQIPGPGWSSEPGVCIAFLKYGHALHDYLSGAGQDEGASPLQGHFIALIGYNSGGWSTRLGCSVPEGFFASDPDNNTQNPVVNGKRVHRAMNPDIVYYTTATLIAAQLADCVAILHNK